MHKLPLTAAAAALALVAAAADARPFTIDDLLHQEALGTVTTAGRWLVYEKADPYDTGDSYDYDAHNQQALSRLYVTDLADPGPARPLLGGADARGLAIVSVSPGGDRLAVTRLRDARLQLGVVHVPDGRATWFEITPDADYYGRTVQWLSDDVLLVLARTDGELPASPAFARRAAERLPPAWAAKARGQLAVQVTGSGAYANLRPRQPPRRLLRLDLRAGAVATLATGPFHDFEAAPDGRHVALLEWTADVRLAPDRPLAPAWGIEARRSGLAVLDVATGALRRPCPGCDVHPSLLAWSPSGRSLLVASRSDDAPWTAGVLRRVDLSGRVAALSRGLEPVVEGRPDVIRAAWLGETPVLLARKPGQSRADWYALAPGGPRPLTGRFTTVAHALTTVTRDAITLMADDRLWAIDPDGRAMRLTEARPAPTSGGPMVKDRTWSMPGPQAQVVLTRADGRRELDQVTGATLAPVTPLPQNGEVAAGSPATAHAVVRVLGPTGVETLTCVGPASKATPIDTLNAPLAQIDAPRILPIHHLGPDGQPLTSWLYLPPRAAGAPPPPLVVRAYVGNRYPSAPRDAPPPSGLTWSLRMLTGHGYAVLTPSLPRPAGTHEPIVGVADRMLAIVDQAARDPATRDAFDPHRVAILGYSYGGYTVMGAITQTDRFRAAVEIAGISNLVSQWGEQGGSAAVSPEQLPWHAATAEGVESGQGNLGAPPWAAPDRYLRNSPIFAADRIHTPLLLVRGDQDLLTLGQGDQMFTALLRQGKDAILVTYRGEAHQITSPGNLRDHWARILGFLDAHLGAAVADSKFFPAGVLATLRPSSEF